MNIVPDSVIYFRSTGTIRRLHGRCKYPGCNVRAFVFGPKQSSCRIHTCICCNMKAASDAFCSSCRVMTKGLKLNDAKEMIRFDRSCCVSGCERTVQDMHLTCSHHTCNSCGLVSRKVKAERFNSTIPHCVCGVCDRNHDAEAKVETTPSVQTVFKQRASTTRVPETKKFSQAQKRYDTPLRTRPTQAPLRIRVEEPESNHSRSRPLSQSSKAVLRPIPIPHALIKAWGKTARLG